MQQLSSAAALSCMQPKMQDYIRRDIYLIIRTVVALNSDPFFRFADHEPKQRSGGTYTNSAEIYGIR